MPTADSIVSGLTAIANEWRALAIGWHVWLGALLLATALGWRPVKRHVGYLLVAPLISVSALAWTSGNPFNATVFVVIAGVMILAARHFSRDPVQLSPLPFLACGAALVAFGWSYPHFLKVDGWIEYGYAAPLGLVPCPTLATVIGLTLVLGLFRPTAWAATLIAAAVLYGVIGVFRLGVLLDYGLLAGGAALAAAVALRAWTRVAPPKAISLSSSATSLPRRRADRQPAP